MQQDIQPTTNAQSQPHGLDRVRMHGYAPCPFCGADSTFMGAYSVDSNHLFIKLACPNSHAWTVPTELETDPIINQEIP